MAEEENLDLEEQEGDDEQSKPAKKKIGLSPALVKILMIVAVVLVAALISGLIAFVVSKSVSKAAGVDGGISDDMRRQAPPTYFAISPEFNVNTADLDVARYVRVGIVLSYSQNTKLLSVELPERTFLLRDRISSIISSYAYDTLRRNEGRQQLKEDIKREVNSMLRNGQIDEVLFDNFLLS